MKFAEVACCWGPSGRSENMKKKGITQFEMSFFDESFVVLGAYDLEQVKLWLDFFQRAKKFIDWLSSIKSLTK